MCESLRICVGNVLNDILKISLLSYEYWDNVLFGHDLTSLMDLHKFHGPMTRHLWIASSSIYGFLCIYEMSLLSLNYIG